MRPGQFWSARLGDRCALSCALMEPSWAGVFRLADTDGNGSMDKGEFVTLVRRLYGLDKTGPVEDLFEKENREDIDADAFERLMREKVTTAVRECKRLDRSTEVDQTTFLLSSVLCCDLSFGCRRSHHTWMDVASNVSRGLLLWCVGVAALAHLIEQPRNCDDPLTTSLYFGTSTVSTCGYGDKTVAEPLGRAMVVLVQLWMMFGQQAMLLPWLCCPLKNLRGQSCGPTNPMCLCAAKCCVFGVALLWLLLLGPQGWNVAELGLTDLLYFLTTSMSTVGYGDVFPVAFPGKSVTILLHLAMLLMDLFARSFDDVTAELADV